MVMRLTEPTDPKTLRIGPIPGFAIPISGHHYQDPASSSTVQASSSGVRGKIMIESQLGFCLKRPVRSICFPGGENRPGSKSRRLVRAWSFV
jgi:hypothetical protein